MVNSSMVRALELARGSWRAQLCVLAIGALLLGVVTMGATNGSHFGIRMAASLFIVMLLTAVSVRAAALRYEEVNSQLLVDELETVAPMLSRLFVHVGVCLAPAVLAVSATLTGAQLHPLLGLVLVPVAFAVVAATLAPATLALVSVMHGERGWLPGAAIRSFRTSPGPMTVTVLAGSVVALLAALPLAVAGLVFAAVGGFASSLGVGLALSAVVPWWGSFALALWQVADVEVSDAAAVEAHAPAAPGDPASEAAQWSEGPRWNVALEPTAAWGSWVRLEAPALVALTVGWSGSGAPRLALADEAGAWISPGELARPGDAVTVQLPAGNTYLQLTSTAAGAQAIAVSMFLGPVSAAA